VSDTVTAFSHLGICVSDLERSLRFYCDGLGFTSGVAHHLGGEFGAALEVGPDAEFTSHFIRRDSVSIELLHYATPSVFGTPSANRNHLGLTHLSFLVDDVDAVLDRLLAHGGTLIAPTRTLIPYPNGASLDLVFVADPDGTRVELVKMPG
jgi:catechol 2,3-dioxygenase-like lactoylglutathione lyase family enzyme